MKIQFLMTLAHGYERIIKNKIKNYKKKKVKNKNQFTMET